MLKRNNLEVAGVVKTGEEALDFISQKKPDIILMDITLSGDLDGIETTEKIKKKAEIPIIFLTAHKGGVNFSKAKEIGADGYLIKDTSLNEQLLLNIEFILSKHEIEKELEESRSLFQKIAISTNDAIITLDNDGKTTFWNAAAEEMFGYLAEEVLGKELHYLIAPDKYIKKYYKNFAIFKKTGEGNAIDKTVELEGQKKNGEIFPIELSLSRLRINGEWHAVGIVRDISERKEYERELKELSDTKDKFFSIVAHDLKNPISGFLNLSELVIEYFDSLEQSEVKEYLGKIKSSSEYLYNLLENLLDWSRTQTERIKFEPKNEDLYSSAVETIQALKLSAEQKGVELKLNAKEGMVAYFDKNMIRTVLRNLISNAIKFSNKGGEVNLDFYDYGSRITISVTDYGVGIEKEDLDKLFRIDSHHTTFGTADERGTGLGLILCKEFVEYNCGEISVKSEPGEGSVFSFSLPKTSGN